MLSIFSNLVTFWIALESVIFYVDKIFLRFFRTFSKNLREFSTWNFQKDTFFIFMLKNANNIRKEHQIFFTFFLTLFLWFYSWKEKRMFEKEWYLWRMWDTCQLWNVESDSHHKYKCWSHITALIFRSTFFSWHGRWCFQQVCIFAFAERRHITALHCCQRNTSIILM